MLWDIVIFLFIYIYIYVFLALLYGCGQRHVHGDQLGNTQCIHSHILQVTHQRCSGRQSMGAIMSCALYLCDTISKQYSFWRDIMFDLFCKCCCSSSMDQFQSKSKPHGDHVQIQSITMAICLTREVRLNSCVGGCLGGWMKDANKTMKNRMSHKTYAPLLFWKRTKQESVGHYHELRKVRN